MAVTFTGAGTAVAASGASPQAVTTATAFAIGDYLVALIAYDNSGGGGADPMSGTISVAPASGSVGASVSAQTGLNDPGAASAGLAARCVCFPVTGAIASGAVVNVSWSGTLVVRAVAFMKVSSAGTTGYRTNSGATGTNAVAATAPALTTPSVNNTEGVLCWAAYEYGVAMTGDADTTNGTWGTRYGNFTGSTTSGQAAYFQGKTVTATATQAFNPTGNLTDWILGCLIFTEVVPPAITQAAYRWYDEGTESGAVALADQDTSVIGNIVNGDATGTLRIRLQATTAVAIPSTDDWTLQYEKNTSGTWINVTASSVGVKTYDSPNLTNAGATTNRLTGGTGSFVAGKVSEDGVMDDLGWSASNYTELVYALKAVAAEVVEGDTLRFRVLRNGATTTMTYTVTPTISIIDEVPPPTPPWSATGLQLWLDASDDDRFEFASANLITDWKDSSGTSHHATVDGSVNPTRVAGAINGLPAVHFQYNVADTMMTTCPGNFPAVTAFAVIRLHQLDNSPSVFGGALGVWSWDLGGNDGQRRMLKKGIGGIGVSTTPIAAEEVALISCDYDSATDVWHHYLNGKLDGTGTQGGVDFDAGTQSLGSYSPNSATWSFNGYMGEVIKFDRVLTTAERRNVEQYLTEKWIPIPQHGLVGWYDAEDSTSFTYSSSTLVSQWADKSGQGHHLTQGTASLQPSRHGSQNGKPTVYFDGVDDALVTSAFTVSQPMTVVAAVNWISYPFIRFFGAGDNSFSIWESTGNLLLNAGSDFDTGLTYNGTYVMSTVFNGASSVAYRDGVAGATGNPGTAGTTTGFKLGGPAYGYVFEVCAYNRVLTTAERKEVEGYLRQKWGTPFSGPLSLPWDNAFWASDPAWTPPADGGGMSTWRNAGSTAIEAYTVYGSPKYRAAFAALNSRPAIESIADVWGMMDCPFPTIDQPIHVFVVGWLDSSAGASCSIFDSTGARFVLRNAPQADYVELDAGMTPGYSAKAVGGARYGAYFIAALYNGASSDCRVNGTDYPLTSDAVPSGDVGPNPFGAIRMFTDSAASMYKGAIAFLGIKNGVLTAGDLAELDAWATEYYFPAPAVVDLAGSSGGVSTSGATELRSAVALVASAAGISTTTATTLAKTIPLAATTGVGASTATATAMIAARALASTTGVGTSTATGSKLNKAIPIAAATAIGTSTATATTLSNIVSLAGASAGLSSFSESGGAAALALTQGAYGGVAPYMDGDVPAITRSLPNWSVTAGELLVVALGTCSSNETQGTPFWNVSGGGLTWTRQVEARRSDGVYKAVSATFTAVASSTTTITDMVGSSTTKALSVFYAYTKAVGYNTSSPVGATIGVADDSVDGQKDIILSGMPAPTSIIWAVVFENSDSGGTGKQIDHGSSLGWTEDFDFGPNVTNSYGTWEGQRKTSPSSTTVRWDDLRPAAVTGGTTYTFAGCAIEIKAGVGGPGFTVVRGLGGSSSGISSAVSTVLLKAIPITAPASSGQSTVTASLDVAGPAGVAVDLAGSAAGISTTTAALARAVPLAATLLPTTTVINDTFDGTAGTPLTAYTPPYVSDLYSSMMVLDGVGNATANAGSVNGGATHSAQLPADCWAEWIVSIPDLTPISTFTGEIKMPAQRWFHGYNLQLSCGGATEELCLLRDDVYDPARAVAVTLQEGVDHALRIEAHGANFKLFVDGAVKLDWTDPSPLTGAGVVGPYTGLSVWTDIVPSSDLKVRSYQAGGIGVGGTATGALTVTGIDVLTGSSAGVSTASALAPEVARALVGTSLATSTATATTLVRSVPLTAATVPGSSTTTGALSRVVGLAGSTTGTSATTGALAAARALTAPTVGGTSTTTGALAAARPLAAASAIGGSTTTGALVATKPIAASAAGGSTAGGTLIVARALVASAAGTSATNANMGASAAGGMSSFVPGTSTATGSLGVARPLAGSASGISTASATTIAKTLQLTATAGGVSATTASAAVARPLAGSTAGSSTTTGSFVGAVTLVGSANGVAATSAALARAVPLTGGSVAGLSTTTAAVRVALGLVGSSVGLSTATATTPRMALALLARADGLSTATAIESTLVRGLAGSTVGASTTEGDLLVFLIVPTYGMWNGRIFEEMQYGDKAVVDWMLTPP